MPLPRDNPSDAVWIHLDGGLGNQMFQYAFGRTLADRRGCELVLDASTYRQSRTGVTARRFALDVFRICAVIHRSPNVYSKTKLRILRQLPAWSERFLRVRTERHMGFDPLAATDVSSRYFLGYWQSPEYFATTRIFEDFSPVRSLGAFAQEFVTHIDPQRSVMIHVRRGDYVTLASASAHHGAMDLSYYQQAVERCQQQRPDAKFYVFSDDVDWCRRVGVVQGASVTYMEPDSARGDWEDLLMMSYCGHHIIANSSFSWWSAWLADHRYGTSGRMVFAPRRWFINDPIRTTDRFPLHWNAL